MANVAKYNKATMGHMMKHYERGKDENGEYVKFKNQQIDPARTHLNYNLAPHNQNQLDFIHKRLSEVYCLKRKDVNVMCSWVVTAPKELPAERHREFFERSYRFLEKKYGKENVISAYVHMDEGQPHMHFAFVPVLFDEKKKREKVSAKEIVTMAELRQFHKDLQREMDSFTASYGHSFECNVLNGATAGGNKAIQELKAQTLAKQNNDLDDLLVSNRIELDFMKSDLDRASRTLEKLQKDIHAGKIAKAALERQITALDGEMVAKSVAEPRLLNKYMNIPQVKESFERFCKSEREKMNNHAKEVVQVGSLEYYRQVIAKERSVNPSRPNPAPKTSSHDRDER